MNKEKLPISSDNSVSTAQLLQIMVKVATEDILEKIFSEFCIGK